MGLFELDSKIPNDNGIVWVRTEPFGGPSNEKIYAVRQKRS